MAKVFKASLINPGYVSKNGKWTVLYRVDNATPEEVEKYKAFKGEYADQCVDIQEVKGKMVECPLVWLDLNSGNSIELIQTTKGNFIQDNSAMMNLQALANKYPMLKGALAQQAIEHFNVFGATKSVNITPVATEVSQEVKDLGEL